MKYPFENGFNQGYDKGFTRGFELGEFVGASKVNNYWMTRFVEDTKRLLLGVPKTRLDKELEEIVRRSDES